MLTKLGRNEKKKQKKKKNTKQKTENFDEPATNLWKR